MVGAAWGLAEMRQAGSMRSQVPLSAAGVPETVS